jgi:hypothetical protein
MTDQVREDKGAEVVVRLDREVAEAYAGRRPGAAELITDAVRAALAAPLEGCERCRGSGHDWELGPTGEPISLGPCPDCYSTAPASDTSLEERDVGLSEALRDLISTVAEAWPIICDGRPEEVAPVRSSMRRARAALADQSAGGGEAEQLVTVDGTVEFMRSEKDSGCACCDGPHIFCRYIEIEGEPGPGRDRPDWRDRIASALFDNRLEGRRVRVILELLPASPQPVVDPLAEEER